MKIPKQKVQTVRWSDGAVILIDQRKLPGQLVYRRCRRLEEVAVAIETLQVRGAPAVGIAAAYGVCLGMRGAPATPDRKTGFLRHLNFVVARLRRTRPTAVNLNWALERMRGVIQQDSDGSVSQWRKRLLREAQAIHEQDRHLCAAIGRAGAGLLRSGDVVMTHCNTGSLATGGLGTAFAVLASAHAQGKRIHVLACEARPVWQGARLTMWELQKYKIPATLICDTAAASMMRKHKPAAVLVGADRIAANGDTANKVGTYGLALLAKAHNIPFYVAAPSSTVDLKTASGARIPIEERATAEVTAPFGLNIAPRGIRAANPAFDVTPHTLITGIITERGILRPPFIRSLKTRNLTGVTPTEPLPPRAGVSRARSARWGRQDPAR
ncbi:MAG: S-methyl-5-thioribose-1-phosphate isomerase [Candidatus Omnitrophica bacterium]|nr:S-methyl-5-thioribose-1-phosphate isomerase [Candidatus Omnitrophota bacterium]